MIVVFGESVDPEVFCICSDNTVPCERLHELANSTSKILRGSKTWMFVFMFPGRIEDGEGTRIVP